MLMTIVVLLLKKVILELPHGGLLHPPRFADDAAENFDDAFGVERPLVFCANAVKNLLLAPAVINRQAGRLLDGSQFVGDAGAFAQQPEQFCVQRINLASALLEKAFCILRSAVTRSTRCGRRSIRAAGCGCGPDCWSLLAHIVFPEKQKPRLSRVAACGIL